MALGLLLILSALAGSESVLYWSSWNRSETSPANAVIGGYSRDYYTFYVIRADLGPNLLPGKFDSTLKVAYVTNDNKEIEVKTFDILRGYNYKWVPQKDGSYPRNAVFGGHSDKDEALYICRVKFQAALTPGKIHPRLRSCYIADNGVEFKFSSYEALVETAELT